MRSATTIFIMTVLVLVYFVMAAKENKAFEVGPDFIKYHANWTKKNDPLSNLESLQNAYQLDTIKKVDISLAMSSLSLDRVKEVLPPIKFQPYEELKINVGNNPIGNEGIDYVLSLIPNGV